MRRLSRSAALSATALAGCVATGAFAQQETEAVALPEIQVTTEGETTGETVSIGSAELERSGPSDLQDVFSGETAVSSGGSIPTAQKVFVHGVEDQLLNVQIDGVKQSTATFHHNGSLLIDPDLLKAVGVDAGVAPADVGPFALGGAIRFETKDARDLLGPDEPFGGFGTLSYDTNSETFSQGLTLYGQTAGFEALAHYSRARGDDYTDGAGDEIRGTEAGLDSALVKLAYTSDGGSRFELSGDWVFDDAIRADRVNFADAINATDSYGPNQFSRTTIALSYVDEAPEGWLDPELKLSYNRTLLENDAVVIPAGAADLYSDIQSISAMASNRFGFDGGDVNAGVDFNRDAAEGGRAGNDDRETSVNVGVFAQANLDVTESARLSFGGRGDQQWFTGIDGSDFSNFGVSGNVSGELDVTHWATLKAGYSNVFGGIPLGEAALQDIFIAPHPFDAPWTYDGLKPSRSQNFTAGVAFAFGNGVTAEIGGFYTAIDGAHDLASTARNTTADITTKGVDVALGYDFGPGFVSAKYSHIDVEVDDLPAGTTDFYFGRAIGDVFAFQAGYDIEGTGLSLGAGAEIALENSDVEELGLAPLEGYQVLNLHAEYTPPGLEALTLRVEANNVFDADYVNRASAGGGSAAVDPLSEPGRSFLLKTKVAF